MKAFQYLIQNAKCEIPVQQLSDKINRVKKKRIKTRIYAIILTKNVKYNEFNCLYNRIKCENDHNKESKKEKRIQSLVHTHTHTHTHNYAN